MSEKHSTKPCKEFLRYDFTHEEVHEMGAELARISTEIARTREEKKAVVTDFNAKITAKEAEVGILGNNINNGYEHRYVECTIHFNTPNTGKKTIFRNDSGEQVKVLNMTSDEIQLDMEFEEFDKPAARMVKLPSDPQE